MTNPFKKKIAVGNMGEEELERLQRTVLTREDTRAEADLLFGAPAKDMRNADRGMLHKLFVQAPAAVTMAPNLQKNASASPFSFMKLAYEIKPEDRPDIPKKQFAQPNKEEAGHKGKYPIPDAQHYRSALGFAKMHGDTKAYAAIKAKGKAMGYDKDEKKEKKSSVEMLKLASMLACGPDGHDSWLTQFEGTSLLPQAIQLEEQALMMDKEEQEQRAEDDIRYATQDQARKAVWAKRDDINFQKRMLALELAKQKAGMGAGGHEAPAQEEQVEPQAQEQQAGLPPPAEMSKTSHVDAFFANREYLTDAQKRYPELLKVAEVGTKKVPNLKPRVTTDTSGPTPTRSSLSGGSA